MTALRDLEHRLLGHVLGDGEFPREWCAQGKVDSDVGLAIYANAYGSRLREALESDHPILSVYLGDSMWTDFCTRFIKDCPSRVRSLRHYGEQAPAWLAANEPFSAHPLIAELAAFERLLMDAFDAADAPRLGWSDIQQLEAESWPQLRFQFHPSVRLLEAGTNVVEVWRALKDEQTPPLASASAATAHLVWRDADRITRFRPIDSNERVALQVSLVEAGDFSLLCERLALRNPSDQVPELAINYLHHWIDEGIVETMFDS